VLAPFVDTDVLTESTATLAERLADDVAQILGEAIQSCGVATLVVSGGSTPKPFLEALAQRAIDWSAVTVTLADERWVDSDHKDSNERFVHQHFLTGKASSATFVPLKTAHTSAHEGKDACEAALAKLRWPVDVVVLGMGEDGHTASLFPDSAGLDVALSDTNQHLCMPIDPPGFPIGRMTLTRTALCHSRHLMLHITGERKRNVLLDALANSDTLEYPVATLMRSEPRPRVYWAPDAGQGHTTATT
jgi:6-phosphogluconolactonase